MRDNETASAVSLGSLVAQETAKLARKSQMLEEALREMVTSGIDVSRFPNVRSMQEWWVRRGGDGRKEVRSKQGGVGVWFSRCCWCVWLAAVLG